MKKSVIFFVIVASAMITVDAACVEREQVEGNVTVSTMDKVKSFFEEVGCTLKPFAEYARNKVSTGYNYLKAKVDESNSGNKTTTNINKKGTNIENLNIILMTNNDSNGNKHVDPDQIIFRETDPLSNGETDANLNTPEYISTNRPPNTQAYPTSNQETTLNHRPISNQETTLNHRPTSNQETTLNYRPTSNHETTLNYRPTSYRDTTPNYHTTSNVDTTYDHQSSSNIDTTFDHHSNSMFDTTLNVGTTSKFGTTIGLAEFPMTTDVYVDDRIALTAPDMCPKGEVRVDGKCRKQFKF